MPQQNDPLEYNPDKIDSQAPDRTILQRAVFDGESLAELLRIVNTPNNEREN
jgi:hypothetical protein